MVWASLKEGRASSMPGTGPPHRERVSSRGFGSGDYEELVEQ